MANKSSIEWTDATWTPIRARVKKDAGEIAERKSWTSLVEIGKKMAGRVGPHCERVSPGCEHCYSETNNSRCLPYNGTGLPFDRRARELVDIFLDENILTQPLHWRQPKNIFVCSQTDLLGEWVPDSFIAAVFGVMAIASDHNFQVLTKRADRLSLFSSNAFREAVIAYVEEVAREISPCLGHRVDELECDDAWPLKNVWLGVSDEGDRHDRIDLLRSVPAAVRWVSFEPLVVNPGAVNLDGIGWVVVGGESGPEARPMHPDWVRGLRDQCRRACVPFLFKQWGEYADLTDEADGSVLLQKSTVYHIFTASGDVLGVGYRDGRDSKGMVESDWKERGGAWMGRIGKKTAGRLLDGVLHDEYPEVRA